MGLGDTQSSSIPKLISTLIEYKVTSHSCTDHSSIVVACPRKYPYVIWFYDFEDGKEHS